MNLVGRNAKMSEFEGSMGVKQQMIEARSVAAGLGNCGNQIISLAARII